MKRLFRLSVAIALLFAVTSSFAQKVYKYDTVTGDPMKVRIYTLDNGFKVYMSVYKDEPRIQTAIAVRTGSKNDPADNTGLSHYLEHMMFKGTEHYGTADYTAEKPVLDLIENLFENYRQTTDTLKRKVIYHQIDSVSGEAAKLAIANEYDKMLGVIGAKGTNAFTSNEETVYINDIPSNQAKTWLDIEFDRFSFPVFRIFHTELETVYEEKNMSLDRDGDKAWEALFAALFQKHQYGTQTTIGTVEHLKNPSLKTLKAYYYSKYVPSNMALCLAGDFDPDSMIVWVDKTFGKMPAKKATAYIPPVEDPITQPIIKEVFGPEAEYMMLAFRFPGANTREADLLSLTNMVLTNSSAGLIDLDLNQAQKVLQAGTFEYVQKDYSSHIFYGYPKQGQTLEEVRDLLLAEIEKLKKGEFDDWLLNAIMNDYKKSQLEGLESNSNRTFSMVNVFIQDSPWKEDVNKIARLSSYTKKDIMDFAKTNYGTNYVIVYKRTGDNSDVVKVSKPQITPVEVNREAQSDFLKRIINISPVEIEPVFINYDKDLEKVKIGDNLEMLYRRNSENSLFSMYFLFKMGKLNNLDLELAVNYLPYLGTSKLSPADVKKEFYKNGVSFGVFCNDDQTWVSLSGLSENMEKGMELFENLIADAQENPPALENLVSDILKQRGDDKLSKSVILWQAMYNYGMYGSKSPLTNFLTEKQLGEVKPAKLLTILHNLFSFQHQILYYGPESQDMVSATITKYHKTPGTLKAVPAETKFTELENKENKVYVVDYDMKQVEIVMLSKSELFNKNNSAIRRIFNEYFGAGMSSIVFQELREARALAYSAFASYRNVGRPDRSHYILTYIGTQNDKLPEAMKGMSDLLNNMPESQKSLDAAKDAVIRQIRTERITKSDILFNYVTSQRLGLDHDFRADVFKQVPDITMADLKAFDEKYIKDRKYTILVLGKKDELDIKTLEGYGKVTYLSLEDIFGY